MTDYKDEHALLEEIDSKKTKQFYNEHNKHTDKYFKHSATEYFTNELVKISDTDLRGLASSFGKYTFWAERKRDWQKTKLLVCKKNEEPRILLDFEDSGDSLDFWYPSPDGRKVLFGVSQDGNEETTIKIIDTTSFQLLTERIPFAGFTDQGGVVWLDGATFIYPRMNGFTQTGPRDKWLLGTKLYRHKIGDDPVHDVLVFDDDLPDTVMLTPSLSSDKKIVYVSSCEDELTHQIFVGRVGVYDFRPIQSDEKSAFYIKAGRGKVYALTNYMAPRFRLLMCDEDDIEEHFDAWDEVLPESDDILQDFWVHRSGLIITKYSHNVASKLNIYDAYGNQTAIVRLPEHSIVQDVSCDADKQPVSVSVSGFTLPTTHYSLDHHSGELTQLWHREPLEGDDLITVAQQWAVSKDRTKVPYFLLRRSDNKGEMPCIIYGYGGFNIAVEPSYLGAMRPWIMAGGTLVIANLRGGSEFGEEWHSGGSMENKQHTFDDCIAIAEYLIKTGVTASENLGVMGGSNGGLLVAGVTVQRPDLFRAGAALVPLTDMLEFYKHQVAEFWVHEYGDPRIPEQAEWIRKWSPYHYPIVDKEPFPALYYETALHDARVSPLHAFKMVARLEKNVRTWKGPLLLRTMTDTGHQSSNLTKAELARRTAEYYAFFARELGLINE